MSSLGFLVPGMEFAYVDKHVEETMSSTLKPIADRIVVERASSDDKTKGGIILPDAAKNKPQQGKVLAVGPGKLMKTGERRPVQVKVGDHVIFASWAGDEFKPISCDHILLLREDDVLAVVG